MIVTLAIAGAALAVLGAFLNAREAGRTAKLGRILLWVGYAMSGASLVLFIIAGVTSPA
jgi:hypothetical protein